MSLMHALKKINVLWMYVTAIIQRAIYLPGFLSVVTSQPISLPFTPRINFHLLIGTRFPEIPRSALYSIHTHSPFPPPLTRHRKDPSVEPPACFTRPCLSSTLRIIRHFRWSPTTVRSLAERRSSVLGRALGRLNAVPASGTRRP
jgi:hypothetical protein